MRAKKFLLSLVFVLLTISVIAIIVISEEGVTGSVNEHILKSTTKQLEPHAPIYINGNSNFTSANGVTSGNGTQNNPYIIEGWDINASKGAEAGIEIVNTDAYFIIRNCISHDGKYSAYYKYGIYFYNVTNGKIDNVTSYNNHYGGWLLHFSNSNISACNIYNNCGYGILLYSSSNNNISACNIYNHYYDGIYLYGSSNNNIISACNIYKNSAGVALLDSSNNNIISACNIYSNSGGIWLDSSSNNNISACNIYNNSDGINLYSSSNAQIHYNNIYDNTNYGIYNDNTAPEYPEYQADATYNWWGSTSGPYNLNTNPSGTGDNVTSNVIYEPWLTEPWVGENQPPTAYIDSITPNPATQGVSVTFVGHGNDTDGTITAYNWRSSIDDFLSNQSSFSMSNLSVGNHTIYFKVQDNTGTWSSEVSETLVINPSAPPTLVVILNANLTTVNSGENSTITVHVTEGANPLTGATINLTSNHGGSFSSVTGNGNGTYTVIFTAPSVTSQTICRITATASKTGYISGSGYVDVTVNPVTVNHAPIVNTVTSSKTNVSPSETVTITVDASDEDVADNLTYHYECTGGTISGSSSTVTWTAPSTAGDYTITVYVNDGKVNSSSKSVDVTVTSAVVDSDGDGYPNDEDAFPNNPSEWQDTDGDGVGDNTDKYPNDPNKWKEEEKKEKGFIPGFEASTLIATIGVCAVLLRKRKLA